jgi:predicted RNase H-like HicB family nuclease
MINNNIITTIFFRHLHPSMKFNAILSPALEGGFVAFNPETGTTTQGETVAEALANLDEAAELYFEEFPSQSD